MYTYYKILLKNNRFGYMLTKQVIIQSLLESSQVTSDVRLLVKKKYILKFKGNIEISDQIIRIESNVLKGLCQIRVMSNFDFLDPGR